MNLDRAVQALSDACTRDTLHRPLQRLDWLARDVLADIGVANDDPPPESQLPWLRQTSVLYAETVIAHPFADLLGQVYQALGSRPTHTARPVLHPGLGEPADRCDVVDAGAAH